MNLKKKILIFLLMILLLIVIPIIINVAFQKYCDIKFLQATWNSGDALSFYGSVLSFLGTVILSSIALWQNNRFKIENDIAQKRLEKISIYSNELNLINRIIDREENRIDKVKIILDDYMNTCNNQSFGIIGYSEVPAVEMTKLENKLDVLLFKLSRETRQDKNSNIHTELSTTYKKMYYMTKTLIGKYRDENNTNFEKQVEEHCNEMSNLLIKYMEHKEKYILLLEKRLDKIIYDKLSLDEIYNLLKNL